MSKARKYTVEELDGLVRFGMDHLKKIVEERRDDDDLTRQAATDLATIANDMIKNRSDGYGNNIYSDS